MTSTGRITKPGLQYTLTHTHTHLLPVQKHLWNHTNTNTNTHIPVHVKNFPLAGSTCRRLIELSSIDPPLHRPGFHTPALFLFQYLHLYQSCPLSFNVIDSPPSKSPCHRRLCSCDLHRYPGLKIEEALIAAVLYHFCPAVTRLRSCQTAPVVARCLECKTPRDVGTSPSVWSEEGLSYGT